jgi:hypothetical protein
MGYQEMTKWIKGGTNKVPSDQIAGIPCGVDKEVNRSHLRQEDLNRWKACKGCCQSKMLMSEPLPSKAKALQLRVDRSFKWLWV